MMGSNANTNYIGHLKNISIDDLKYVEKDMSFHDKVSLSFLLFANSRANAHFILQKLIVLAKANASDSDILFSYTKINDNWKSFLLEALTIIKAKKIVRKLGFTFLEIKDVFLPHIPQISLNINTTLKALYTMCEMLTPAEAGKLILEINASNNISISYYDHSCMEMFLLAWIANSVITIGNCSNLPSNLDVLLRALKLNEMETQKNIISESLKQSNYIGNKLEREKEIPSPLPIASSNCNVGDTAANKAFTNAKFTSTTFDRKDSVPYDTDDCYIVRKEIAGFVLIINQLEFNREKNPELQDLLSENQLTARRGSDMDKKIISRVFTGFGYTPIEKDNLTHHEILQEIREVVNRSKFYDSLVVCILSHGIEGAIYGSNSIPVEISAIENILAADSLLGKPKMLILQACQGKQMQTAKKVCGVVQMLESDAPSSMTIPAFSDMITAKATVPGFSAIRHTEKGTWFIQSLCENLDKLGDRRHVLDILTAVNRDVTSMRGYDNQCMVPITSQTLTKCFYLPRRV